MKRKSLILVALLLVLTASAQTAREEIRENIFRSGSNYYAYPGPTQQKLTPAPKGKKPFYISHYGRHGSRHLISRSDYNNALTPLLRADSLGKLTDLGRDVLSRVQRIYDEGYSRRGELTQRGAEQHRQIAHRMYERFPDVFKGSAPIDAKSTTVIRCILSMENALQELVSLNPKLRIKHDASAHDMWYMNFDDRELSAKRMPEDVKKAYDEFCQRHYNYERVMKLIFNDDNYWRNEVNAQNLNYHLFKLASNMQSLELRHSMTLYDLFNEQEVYDNWLQTNAWWYINYGPCPLNGAEQPFIERNLLRRMIEEADSCLQFDHPGATLRYGHEVCVMPLACLMELDNCAKQVSDLEQLADQGWLNYKIYPMGCNIQMVFYRKNLADKDILVKVLLNENEAKLPLQTDTAPYYKWADVRAYYLQKLNQYGR